MTATHVDGVAVIADEPAQSKIRDAAGQPVTYKRIRRLLPADERIVYGCLLCEFTSPTAERVRPHMNKHRDPDSPKRQRAKALLDMSLTELAGKIAQLEALTAERDAWKARALKAEKSLATLRTALREG